jgi:predicted metal-dependent peptidase
MINDINDFNIVTKKMMLKEPFYGLFLMTLNKHADLSIPTACVSKQGINQQLSINPEYWNSLNENTRLGLLKHELLHIVFFHLDLRSKYSDKLLFNLAADMEVNQYIDDECLGQDWVLLSSYPELNLPLKAGTKVYYEILEQNLGTGKSPSLDEHYKNMKGNDIHEFWEFYESLSESERKLMDKQVNYQLKEIAEQIKKNKGSIPGEIKSYISSLFEIIPSVIDWKGYFKRFIGFSNKIYTKKTRNKINNRFPDNPSLRIKSKNHVLIGIDTSGSVSDKDLTEFFNEIYHIYKTGIQLTIIECDAAIHKIYEYKGKRPEYIHGRGGTSFQPVINYFNDNHKKYTSLVYLTDGECSPPTKPRNPMLWVISSRNKINTNLPGKQIQITYESK